MRGFVVIVAGALGCGRVNFDVLAETGDAGNDATAAPTNILFVRAADGTVGYMNGDTDDNACDITDTTGDHGWGMLGAALIARGFTLIQVVETAQGVPSLANASLLGGFAAIVFGSNNFAYQGEHADAVEQYVREGGAALFISDAGFGRTSYDESPASDQPFLQRFDLQMLQDANDVITLDATRFPDPTHPVLDGVSTIRADGTSALRITNGRVDVEPTLVIAKAPGNVRVAGAIQMATAADAALAVADVGLGRVAGLCDRDIFANSNAASASGITLADNLTLAMNLFEWLTGRR